MSKHKFLKNTVFFLALTFTLVSCPSNEEFGADADYFIGLQKMQDGNIKEAKQKFNNCIKKGTYSCGKESAKQLAAMGNLQERNEAATILYEKYPDEDSLLINAQAFYNSNELRKLFDLTKDLDLSTANDNLVKLRLNALLKSKENQKFFDETYSWFTSKSITQEQYQFYRDTYLPLINSKIEELQSEKPESDTQTIQENYFIDNPKDFAIRYRITLYRRDYLSGYSQANQLMDFLKDRQIIPCSMIASDLGKALLYGSENIIQDAVNLRKRVIEVSQTEAEFYYWFYAARLYDAGNLYYTQAITCYENAIKSTESPEKKDNALWYLLKTKLKLSVDQTLSTIKEYASSWYDPEYFDDFFESLIPTLLVNGKYSAFPQLLTNLDGYATKETYSQLSYLYGRLIEEGLITVDEDKKAETIKLAYEKALDCGTAYYYRFLAAYRLGLSDETLEKLFYAGPQFILQEKDYKYEETPSDILLRGYAYFGYPQKIYSEWQNLLQTDLTAETGFYLSDFLSKCAEQNTDYYVQSLRIAAKAEKLTKKPLNKDELKLIYPQYFKNLVDTYSKKYDIKSSVLYALIRSESFFDAEVVSSAGAIGLTQLMTPTAGEVAQKLKIKEYSLTDPETNIKFGTYYLSELIRRGDGSLLRAFFSYNAGFRKVTNWLNSSLIDLGHNKEICMDLFLETIPVSETRGYGRKLVSATVFYEYLYGNSSFSEIMESLLK